MFKRYGEYISIELTDNGGVIGQFEFRGWMILMGVAQFVDGVIAIMTLGLVQVGHTMFIAEQIAKRRMRLRKEKE